jgi:hypothetical protein
MKIRGAKLSCLSVEPGTRGHKSNRSKNTESGSQGPGSQGAAIIAAEQG